MRLRIILLVIAISSMVLISFLVPLALVLRTFAADRAVSSATVQAQWMAPLVATLDAAGLKLAVAQVNGEDRNQPVTVFLPDGRVLGRPAAHSAGVRLAAKGRSFATQTQGGVEVLVAVQGLPQGTAVIRTFVPAAELRAGVVRAWLLLCAVGLGLLVLSVVVADQLARSLVRPLGDLARASDLLAAGHLATRAQVTVAGGAAGQRGAEPARRAHRRAAGPRAGNGRRSVPPAAHAADRPAHQRRVTA
jgi:methyl-accepting chemotaxis protein